MAVKRKTIHNLVWQKLVPTYRREINNFPQICLSPTYRRDVYTVVLGLVTGQLGLVTLLLEIAPGLVPVFSNCTPLRVTHYNQKNFIYCTYFQRITIYLYTYILLVLQQIIIRLNVLVFCMLKWNKYVYFYMLLQSFRIFRRVFFCVFHYMFTQPELYNSCPLEQENVRKIREIKLKHQNYMIYSITHCDI